MKKRRLLFLIIGLTILSLFLLACCFPSVFTPYSRKESFAPWLKISNEHILGTNSLGYDIFTELVYGTRDTLAIGLLSSLFSIFLGVIAGVLASLKGIIGNIFRFLLDSLSMLPRTILLIVLSVYIGKTAIGLIIVISLFAFVKSARAIKARIIHLLSLPFIETLKMYHYSRLHIALRHILPNLYDILLSEFLSGITSCILMESTLSFLGIGNLYYPSWGTMIRLSINRGAIALKAYGYLLAPCFCIMLVCLSFYFISLYVEGRHETILDPEHL